LVQKNAKMKRKAASIAGDTDIQRVGCGLMWGGGGGGTSETRIFLKESFTGGKWQLAEKDTQQGRPIAAARDG